ncbi:hypothetical protein F4802DRAFT_576219 [Xylaria palmicola]|nr:hypothetical protein F4802DRAFT_576219 [Xylaria palmicola]
MTGVANTFDVIIVGGGTAGLVVASRLSEDPALNVLVLEAGQDLPQLPEQLMQTILTPVGHSQLHRSPVDWDLKTVPQTNLKGRELRVPQGKMLGGSSGLNGLSFTASAQTLVDEWAALGNPGWEWSSFSQSLVETHTVVKAPPSIAAGSGGHGPLKVAYADDYASGWPKVWAETMESLGFPGAQNMLTSQAPGGVMIPDTVDPALGIRSYAVNAYLSPEVRGRANLTVITGVEVKKIVMRKPSSGDGDRNGDGDAVATGVEYIESATGAAKTATVRREVVVSAGVFGSPKILEISGVGDARRLGAHNVVADVPGVGENLQNHPLITVSLEVADGAPPTKDAFLRAILRQDPEVLGSAMGEYIQHHRGVFASSGVTSGAVLPLPGLETPAGKKALESLLDNSGALSDGLFAVAHEKFVRSIISSPSETSGYYIFGPAYAAFNPDGTGAAPPLDGSEDSYITIVCSLAHPLSRGSVHVISTGADQRLVIDPRFFSHPLDLEVMARHVQFIENGLATTAPMAKYLKPNGKRAIGAPGAGALEDLDAAKEFIKDHAIGAHHYTGSCSMLPREMGGVVDSQLRVYGTANLRVCDASVIPLTPRTNPQATVYGVAEHGAKLIKSSLRSG